MSLSSLKLPRYDINPSLRLLNNPLVQALSSLTFESALAKRLPPRVSVKVVVSTLTQWYQWATFSHSIRDITLISPISLIEVVFLQWWNSIKI